MMLTIILPLPSPKLSPNARHAGRIGAIIKSRAVAKARAEAKLMATSALNEQGWKPPRWQRATIRARFYFRTNRRHDADNLISSAKAPADGFTDAGVWLDDSGVLWLPPEMHVDPKNPRVEFDVWETDDWREAIGCAPVKPGSISAEEAIRRGRGR